MTRGINTRCLHLTDEEKNTDHYGSLSFPIYQTATYAHPEVGKSTGFDYSRLQNPTREHLEKIICGLEDGIDAFALSTGMAAIRLFDNISKKNGYKFSFVDCSSADLEKEIRPNTKAIYIETPTNPMMRVSDIEKIAGIAKAHGLLLIVDNTFLSPYFQNPLKLGADVVIHSGTKFLGGHNDTLAGFIVTKDPKIAERLRFLIKTTGSGLAPFDSWLLIRGIKTLGIRMEKAQEKWRRRNRH